MKEKSVSLLLPETLKKKLGQYLDKANQLKHTLQEFINTLQLRALELIEKDKSISFDDFVITKEVTIEEYIQKKDAYNDMKFKTEDTINGYVYMHNAQCYSFNHFSNIFLKKQSGNAKLLIVENHINANKTRMMFAYHLSGEHVYDQSNLEMSSKFYEKDMNKLEFLMQYHLKTLDSIYIMSDKPYYKISDISAFLAIEQVECNEILNTFSKVKVLNSTQGRVKLWLLMLILTIIYPVLSFFAFDRLLEDLDLEYQNRLKTQKIKITAAENQLAKIKKDLVEINNKIKISKKEIYESGK